MSKRIWWFRFLSMPVVIGDLKFTWSKVLGIRIGSWFIGAIKGVPKG